METNSLQNEPYQKYASFWNSNAQTVDELQHELNAALQDLENIYIPFEEQYVRIQKLTGVLSSIYSGFNTINGRNDILKLKSFIDTYAIRYTRQSIDFQTMNYLLEKISHLRDQSFEDFPALDHSESNVQTYKYAEIDFGRFNFHWITFRRRHSWFMVPFNSLVVIPADECESITLTAPGEYAVEFQEEKHTFKDIFGPLEKTDENPEYFLIINESAKIASSQCGRRIYAKKDIMESRIKEFPSYRKHTRSPGRIRLFGKNHLYMTAESVTAEGNA